MTAADVARHPLVTSELTEADISWNLPPAERSPADADLLVEALTEAESYRAISQQAIHALHAADERDRRHRDQREQLVDELRRLRVLFLDVKA
jgi:hypothetical protein